MPDEERPRRNKVSLPYLKSAVNKFYMLNELSYRALMESYYMKNTKFIRGDHLQGRKIEIH